MGRRHFTSDKPLEGALSSSYKYSFQGYGNVKYTLFHVQNEVLEFVIAVFKCVFLEPAVSLKSMRSNA